MQKPDTTAAMVKWIAFFVLAWMAAPRADAAPAVPAWIRSVESIPTPKLPGDVPSHVLFTEKVITIGSDGVATEQVRHAMRVLTQKGDADAVARLPYTEKVDKIVSGTAWLVRAGKVVKSEQVTKWLDLCQISDGTVFTEQRVRVVSFPRETLRGDVFAFETVSRRPMLFTRFTQEFDRGTPTAAQRMQIVLPAGWSLQVISSGDLPEPTVDPAKRSWTWELTQRPYIPEEPWTPRVVPEAPRLMVTFIPPAVTKGFSFPVLDTWSDVGVWVEQIGSGQCDRDTALSGVVSRLTGEVAGGDRLALVRALALHVQRLRYVGVVRGLGLGFGYKPRKATEVLARGFGDCKDKVNLLRSMLQEVGIASHMVLVESGWRYPTIEAWPSPTQFNHVIIAIEVDESVDLPAVVATGSGQRLLFFDPTDEYTVLGDLPWYVQGSSGLLVRGADSALVAVPAMPPEQEWVYETRARLVIGPDGSGEGTADFIGRRQGGRGTRAVLRNLAAKQLNETATQYMSTMLRGVVVRDPEFIDDTVSGDATFRFNMSVPGVFQAGPGGMLMMRLDVFNRDSVPQLGTKPRVQPVEIRPVDHSEDVSFVLPAGVSVDDMPKPARVESGYGSYERQVEVSGDTIVLRRRLQLRPQTIPASDFEKLRAFLTAATRADKAAVVLQRAQ